MLAIIAISLEKIFLVSKKKLKPLSISWGQHRIIKKVAINNDITKSTNKFFINILILLLNLFVNINNPKTNTGNITSRKEILVPHPKPIKKEKIIRFLILFFSKLFKYFKKK